MIRPLVLFPDPILRRPSAYVNAVDAGVRELVQDLVHTMRHLKGFGLAAPQIGVPVRVAVVDTTRIQDPKRELLDDTFEMSRPLVLINPQLSEFRGKATAIEGCFSLPGRSIPMRRFTRILVKYVDEHGVGQRGESRGFEARVIQHEIDHLDGILITDTGSKVRSRTREAMA